MIEEEICVKVGRNSFFILFILLLLPYLSYFASTESKIMPAFTLPQCNVKESITVCRGEWFNFTVLVTDLNGSPAEGVYVLLTDAGHNLKISIVPSNASGYATFKWLISRNYYLGPTTLTFTPVYWNGNDFVPDPNFQAAPSSLNVTILSRSNLDALSYPTTLTKGAVHHITLLLTDNLQAPLAGAVIRLYIDDLLLAGGPTNESGTVDLPFIVPSSLQLGTHNLTAIYLGDETHTPATLTLQVEVAFQIEDPTIVSFSLNVSVVKPSSPVKVTVQTSGSVSSVYLNNTLLLKIGEDLWETTFSAPATQGNHTLLLRAAGNDKEYVATTHLYVDATPPRINAYLNNTYPKPGEPIEIIVNAIDETGVVKVSVNNVDVSLEGNAWRLVTNAPIDEGTYSFNVAAWDKAGNMASTTITYHVASDAETKPGDPTGKHDGLNVSSLIISLMLYHSNENDSSWQIAFIVTLASCTSLLLVVFKRTQGFELVEDFNPLDSSPLPP